MIRPIAFWRRRRAETDHLGRDAKDFAIEHAGYLADAVERVLKVESSILDAEDWLDLNTRVYEFRKHAARTIRPLAFCVGLALAWCGTAQAERVPLNSWAISKPDDEVKADIDDLKGRVTELEQVIDLLLPTVRIMQKTIHGLLPECSGEPPEHLPCVEREAK